MRNAIRLAAAAALSAVTLSTGLGSAGAHSQVRYADLFQQLTVQSEAGKTLWFACEISNAVDEFAAMVTIRSDDGYRAFVISSAGQPRVVASAGEEQFKIDVPPKPAASGGRRFAFGSDSHYSQSIRGAWAAFGTNVVCGASSGLRPTYPSDGPTLGTPTDVALERALFATIADFDGASAAVRPTIGVRAPGRRSFAADGELLALFGLESSGVPGGLATATGPEGQNPTGLDTMFIQAPDTHGTWTFTLAGAQTQSSSAYVLVLMDLPAAP